MTRQHNLTPSGRLLEQSQPGLYRYLLRRLKGGEDAEDLAQLIYMRFLQAPNLSAIREPQAYLYRIAANVVSEYILRRKSERVTYDSRLTDELAERSVDPWTDDAGDQLHSAQIFQQTTQRLPVTHRVVFVLFAREGLTVDAIGERLGLSVLTVRKYLRQALARLREAQWE